MESPTIVVFAYNRPDHLKRTLDALSENPGAPETRLVLYLDGAKEARHEIKVAEVFTIADNEKRFLKKELIKRSKNFGLFQNIKQGIDEVLSCSDSVVVLEDDTVPAPSFYSFLKKGLFHYKNDTRIFSLSGYQYPTNYFPNLDQDAYFSRRFSCWGWAIWKDRWSSVNWTQPTHKEFIRDKIFVQKLSQASNDLPELVCDALLGRNQSWSIFPAMTQVRNGKYSIHPQISLVSNWGFDGSGVHSNSSKNHIDRVDMAYEHIWKWPENPYPQQVDAISEHFKNSFFRKIKNKVNYGFWG